MPMPETTMGKNNRFVFRENNIRFSWKMSGHGGETGIPGKIIPSGEVSPALYPFRVYRTSSGFELLD